ncbi:hypothetical protein FQN54_005149 [Arachnomyces sp. PD_36]|nr:hypothetical protein FQN54_005149 [Arachnomyces sp. PD_36]
MSMYLPIPQLPLRPPRGILPCTECILSNFRTPANYNAHCTFEEEDRRVTECEKCQDLYLPCGKCVGDVSASPERYGLVGKERCEQCEDCGLECTSVPESLHDMCRDMYETSCLLPLLETKRGWMHVEFALDAQFNEFREELAMIEELERERERERENDANDGGLADSRATSLSTVKNDGPREKMDALVDSVEKTTGAMTGVAASVKALSREIRALRNRGREGEGDGEHVGKKRKLFDDDGEDDYEDEGQEIVSVLADEIASTTTQNENAPQAGGDRKRVWDLTMEVPANWSKERLKAVLTSMGGTPRWVEDRP